MPGARVWTWRLLVPVTLARVVLVGLLGLAAWGALPAVVGWHPTTVSSGSMLPRLHVGDVAVSRPVGASTPPLGSVLLFDDPDHEGRLRMHRFVRVADDGLLVTRGDANPQDDSTPVALTAVHGIGTLRVPWIALPIVWLRTGRWLLLGLVAAGLALLVVVATSGRDRVFADDPPDEQDPRTGDGDQSGSGTLVAASRARPRTRARSVWTRGAACVAAGLLAVVLGDPARAAFTSRTTTTASFTMSAASTCAATVASLSPYFYYRMDEAASTTAATDSSGNGRTGVYSATGRTSTTDRPCARDTGNAMIFDGANGALGSPGLPGGMPNVFSLSIWFRTSTQSGGKLIGFGSSQTGSSGTYDRHVYMANSGRLFFGVYANAVRTVSSTTAYNDNAWHLAVATLSSAGLRLYVDGALVGSDPATTNGEPGSSAYVRVGYDNLSNWDSTPSSYYFGGTLDDAAYYTTALTADQVSALYQSRV